MNEQMKKHSYRHVKIAFRIVGLSSKNFDVMKARVLRTHSHRIGKHYKNPELFVVSIDLKKGQKYDDLCNFLRTHKIPQSSYGFWMSVVTSNDIGGVEMPDHAIELFKKTGGSIGFSFVRG